MEIVYVGSLSEGSVQEGERSYPFQRDRPFSVPVELGRRLIDQNPEDFQAARTVEPLRSAPLQPAFLSRVVVKEAPEPVEAPDAEGGVSSTPESEG